MLLPRPARVLFCLFSRFRSACLSDNLVYPMDPDDPTPPLVISLGNFPIMKPLYVDTTGYGTYVQPVGSQPSHDGTMDDEMVCELNIFHIKLQLQKGPDSRTNHLCYRKSLGTLCDVSIPETSWCLTCLSCFLLRNRRWHCQQPMLSSECLACRLSNPVAEIVREAAICIISASWRLFRLHRFANISETSDDVFQQGKSVNQVSWLKKDTEKGQRVVVSAESFLGYQWFLGRTEREDASICDARWFGHRESWCNRQDPKKNGLENRNSCSESTHRETSLLAEKKASGGVQEAKRRNFQRIELGLFESWAEDSCLWSLWGCLISMKLSHVAKKVFTFMKTGGKWKQSQ